MSARVHTVGQALFGLVGPIIWAAHFFSLYLAEAVLCVSADANASVRIAGVALTVATIAALLYARRRATRSPWASFIRPLIDLSMLAVVWTAVPLVALQTCAPAGA
jgi:hypothetical protein